MRRGELLQQASRAAFWNALLLPLITFLNLLFSVLIRRGFGLGSGLYDILIGLVNGLLIYTSLGIPNSLTKFLPELEITSGRQPLAAFLRQATFFRVALLVLALVPMNLLAGPLADHLDLGPRGPLLVHLLSGLVLARAFFELAVKALQAFLAHFWANLVSVIKAALDAILVAAVLLLGYGMGGVLVGLFLSAGVVALLGGCLVRRHLTRGPAAEQRAAAATGGEEPAAWRYGRFLRFAVFTYVFELSTYFAGLAFASPALAAVLGDHRQVALFATGFNVVFMTVVLVVSGFRGLYWPMLARVRARRDPEQLRRAFSVISKAQVFLLLPAGVGLGVMVADYLPLLYGAAFNPAVPLTRVLIAFLFIETAFNLGVMVLTIDERYRAALGSQSILVAGAPLFALAATHGGLLPAAFVLGGSRMMVSLTGYCICRRRYGFRFPWAFTARVAAPSGVMGALLLAARQVWPTSAVEATVLTLAGAAIFGAGVRLGRLLGPDEVDLIRRAEFPGHRTLIRWLAPRN